MSFLSTTADVRAFLTTVTVVTLATVAGTALPPSLSAQRVAETGSGAGEDAAASSADATHDAPTYYGNALPALQRNCVSCHRTDAPDLGGLVAPMSLMSYEEAKSWAPMIAQVLRTGYMPPWDAHEQHEGEFKDERYISDADRRTLIEWAEAGAPMGDPALKPSNEEILAEAVSAEPVEAPDGSMWWMGVPDMVVGFDEPVEVCDAVEDWQPRMRLHVSDGAHTEPKWIQGMEIRPGSDIVHHTVSSHLGVGVPGRGPFVFPEGWGILLPEDPYITISMHYHKTPGPGTAVMDDTQGGFMFYEEGDVIDHVVETDLQAYMDFTIPPGDPSYAVRNTTHFDEDIYLLSMGPHAHYRGKAVKIELERPGSLERETLLWVPDYDFNWQFQYEFEEPYFIPAGSRMHITWWYDNSEDNPYNPDPSAEVTWGLATTDEMMNARIYYAKAEPQGIVVGEDIPADVLQRAREEEERNRERAQSGEEAQSCAEAAAGVAGD